MEAAAASSLHPVKAHNFTFSSNKQKPTIPFLPFHRNLKVPTAFEGKGVRSSQNLRCAKQGSVIDPGDALSSGSGIDSGLKEMGKRRGKCQEEGMVELLECLEREAIMGEDEGRAPTDYDRRAKIFSESARVFRALKEADHTPSHHS